MAVRLGEIIDRIRITLPLTPSQYTVCNDQLWNEVKGRKGKLKQIGDGCWLGKFALGGDVCAEITVGKLYGHRFLQYDFQPAELDAITFGEFLQIGSSFPAATYPDALVHGKVSYLEIAIDFLFKDTSDLLIHKPGVNASCRFFPSGGGAPTSYTGSTKSTSRTAAYTKAKPFDIGGAKFTCQRSRLERRVRYPGCAPIQLGSLPNQFAGVAVVSIAAAESLTNHKVMQWIPFLQIAKAKGIASALAHFPEHRKQFLKLLKQCEVPWWRPADYMKKWGQTVASQLRLHLACN